MTPLDHVGLRTRGGKRRIVGPGETFNLEPRDGDTLVRMRKAEKLIDV